MQLNDPRASSFSAAAFRDGIKFAMRMAKPDALSERVRFGWVTTRTFATADPSGNPYDWGSAPSAQTVRDLVEIDCAVEFTPRAQATRLETGMGEFTPSMVALTVLDADYALIQGADFVVIGNATYDIVLWEPPVNLFEVEVYSIHARARDAGAL